MTSEQNEQLPKAGETRTAQRRDLLGILIAVVIAGVLVYFFDTGSLAEWIAAHKDTKVDEVITVTFVLAVALAIFSIRRLREVSHQLIRYEVLYRSMEKLSRESLLLGEMSDLLRSCLSVAEAHQFITERAQMLFPNSSGAVCMTANSRDIVEVVSTWGNPAFAERFFPPKDCWALRRGRAHVMGADSNAMYCAHIGDSHPSRAMCMPMMAHGEALGLFYLDSGRNENTEDGQAAGAWSESDQRLARTVAEHAALALANLQLREILRTQSVRDPLTGLYNRRYLEESLDRELQRAARKKTSLGVMMLDVDHFKRFNDAFGHEAGDSVLKALANLFRTQLRGSDVACRYGGEEFALLLPEASLAATRQRAEELREAAKHAIAQFRGNPLDPITLSVGVATFPEQGTREGLMRAADEALYKAKEQGRDRVIVA